MDSHHNKQPLSLMRFLQKLPANAAIVLVQCYRLIFSPSVGVLRYLPFYPRPSCIFHPSCSEYAIQCFRMYPFFTALQKSITRIGRCHPGNEPRVDLP